ncbi:MAG: transporter related protein [Pseudonocardiales bacterium]|nr:transporter related protein [Pseudonocardiales bacterium]
MSGPFANSAFSGRLVASNLSKRYGAHLALRGVDFVIGSGEIVAVVGENGAGKSTLSKILGGAIRPDSGDLRLDDQVLHLNTPREALRAGISYIPQELAYLPNLTVAENLLVGQWPNRAGFTNRLTVRRKASRIADEFGIELDVRQPIAELGLAERQLVEILKALARETKVLILDEPTASLTSEESANLFRVLRGLAATGVSVIFISHRLDEIFEIADRLLVLRNGEVVANLITSETTPRQLIDHMLGREVAQAERELGASSTSGSPALTVRGWSRPGLPNITELDFELRAGEILGLFGPRGSGADLIADGLGGRIGDFHGTVDIGGVERPAFDSPRDSRAAGIGYVPPERKRDGLNLEASVTNNLSMLVLGSVSRFGFINRFAERRMAQEWRETLQVNCRSVAQEVGALSGGNQQKVLLGSRLAARPSFLVLNEPTRGVDVGTRVQIHRYLKQEAARGTSVLWVTSDIEEAVVVSDRLLVMRDGSIVGELTGTAMTQANALAMATGERSAA